MNNFFYSADVQKFISQSESEIIGILATNNIFELQETQRNAWLEEIHILKNSLQGLDTGRIILEYTIPRIGQRIDAVILYKGIIFPIEFKIGKDKILREDINQLMNYALDLKYFHAESNSRTILPILIATNALIAEREFIKYADDVYSPIYSNGADLKDILENTKVTPKDYFDYIKWENSPYTPTPTIIEAAQVLYANHGIRDISRSDAGATNLTKTTDAISNIIDYSKKKNIKSICFVTGVPGAGKTLAGLNIANSRHKFEKQEHAIFLSGNDPLVMVLQEALIRSERKNNPKVKSSTKSKVKSFIQNIRHFRDSSLSNTNPPIEKVVIFDEAQRAWTKEQLAFFMKRKRGITNFSKSEPEFLIEIMDRHSEWAVIICLVGGGQEINTGEAGLSEWFNTLKNKFSDWHIFVSNEITDSEYGVTNTLNEYSCSVNLTFEKDLHLSTSIRSFRSENVSLFVKELLDNEIVKAKSIFQELKNKYPIFITRNIEKARKWLKEKARGTERYGIIASSGAKRLKPYGLFVQCKISPENWFLNNDTAVNSSYYLEDVATEFDVQGLELDWTCVAWDADFMYNNYWICKKFRGTKWQNIRKEDDILFKKNAYRVLMTRARQGMIIFIPTGNLDDHTATPDLYDGVYNLFMQIGVPEI